MVSEAETVATKGWVETGVLDAPEPEPDSVALPLPSVPVAVALALDAAEDRTLAPEAEAVEAVAEPLALERALAQ